MKISPVRAWIIPSLALASTVLLFAQDWEAAKNLPGVDLAGLTPSLKERALHALRTYDCSCGCGMKVAECRVKDPNCAFSRGLSSTLVESIRKGKAEAAA